MNVLRVLIGVLITAITMWDLTHVHVTLDSGSIQMDMDVTVTRRLPSILSHLFNTFHLDHADIDECTEGTDRCDQNCHNNVGSYTCTCNSGYRLNANGYGCDGTLEIIINLSNLQASLIT